MGSYGISQKELEESLESFLDGLEGDFDRKDFILASYNVARKYKSFTDGKV